MMMLCTYVATKLVISDLCIVLIQYTCTIALNSLLFCSYISYSCYDSSYCLIWQHLTISMEKIQESEE